jgi:ankyrin repeat protein
MTCAPLLTELQRKEFMYLPDTKEHLQMRLFFAKEGPLMNPFLVGKDGKRLVLMYHFTTLEPAQLDAFYNEVDLLMKQAGLPIRFNTRPSMPVLHLTPAMEQAVARDMEQLVREPQTFLQAVRISNYPEKWITRLLSQKGNEGINERDVDGMMPLDILIRSGQTKAARLLIQAGAQSVRSLQDALLEAIRWQKHAAVRTAVSLGAVVSEDDWLAIVGENDTEMARILIGMGVSIPIDTGFFIEAISGTSDDNREMLEILMRQGADINGVSNGFTPLGFLVKNGDYQAEEKIKLILSLGADPDKIDKHGFTPLDYAQQKNQRKIYDLLMQARKHQKKYPQEKNEEGAQKLLIRSNL